VIRNVSSVSCINAVLRYLGKYSMDIYMIHTFIFYYFFKDFIYSFKYPILIFCALMIICLTISVFLEYFKKIICLPVLIKKINLKISY
jgi:peptidoglycan/LPS O-acetylase OafA/YrhL